MCSVHTCTGYGNVYPTTPLGMLVTVAYAFCGLPLYFTFLLSIGDIMAHSFRHAYHRGSVMSEWRMRACNTDAVLIVTNDVDASIESWSRRKSSTTALS